VVCALKEVREDVTSDPQSDLTELIRAWAAGDANALGLLVSSVYPELRRIARQQLRRHRTDQSLESTALAHEAYLKLLRSGGIQCEDRVHFLALCAQVTRRILVDHARGRASLKRGGETVLITLHDDVKDAAADRIDTLALNDALEALTKIDQRKGRVVELRYFGGLSLEETAEALGISPETVKRDWRMARAWLFGELRRRK
jgi:RNA polymerase sigma factor (TIGR02999 family)